MLGNLRKMENTQHPLLTMPSLLAQPTTTLKHSSGNLGHRLNVNFSAGLLFKTKYGPPTDWKLGGGQTKEPAHNVGFMRRHACTFSGIAGSRSDCGENRHLDTKLWTAGMLEKWWTNMSVAPGMSRKGLHSLIILVC